MRELQYKVAVEKGRQKLITTLKPNEVFVFGSNLAGHHEAGAARQALLQFGARTGVGEGLTSNTALSGNPSSYAFPTLGYGLERRSNADLEESRDRLYRCCAMHPDLNFLLTKVGCGIAGYPESTMRALFVNAPQNLELPEEWK